MLVTFTLTWTHWSLVRNLMKCLIYVTVFWRVINPDCLDFLPTNCDEFMNLGFDWDQYDGPFTIERPTSPRRPLNVSCDFDADGGWIVMQRRFDGSVNFSRTWLEYKDGFGDVSGEHWLGNEIVHELTREGDWTLRVQLWDWEGYTTSLPDYSDFKLENEAKEYKIMFDSLPSNIDRDLVDPFNSRKSFPKNVDEVMK